MFIICYCTLVKLHSVSLLGTMSQGIDARTARDLRAKSRSTSMGNTPTGSGKSESNMATKNKTKEGVKPGALYQQQQQQRQQQQEVDSANLKVPSMSQSASKSPKERVKTRGSSLSDIIKKYEESASNSNVYLLDAECSGTPGIDVDTSKHSQLGTQSNQSPNVDGKQKASVAHLPPTSPSPDSPGEGLPKDLTAATLPPPPPAPISHLFWGPGRLRPQNYPKL